MSIKGALSEIKLKSPILMGPRKRKGKLKPKLNITLSEESKRKLAALAQLEKRSVSNLIEVIAETRWEELAGRAGIDYTKIVSRDRWLKRIKLGPCVRASRSRCLQHRKVRITSMT